MYHRNTRTTAWCLKLKLRSCCCCCATRGGGGHRRRREPKATFSLEQPRKVNRLQVAELRANDIQTDRHVGVGALVQKNASFPPTVLFLCLSRACLGKLIVFSIKSCQKRRVSHHPARECRRWQVPVRSERASMVQPQDSNQDWSPCFLQGKTLWDTNAAPGIY